MKTYTVTFTLTVEDGTRPEKWIPETVGESLERRIGEGATDWNFELQDPNVATAEDPQQGTQP